MALRMTIDGVEIACDTPQEVVEVLRAVKGSSKPSPKVSTMQTPVNRSTQSSRPDPGLFKTNEGSGEPRSLTGNRLDVLMALKESFPNGVSSDQLGDRIGKRRTSIPIIMVSLHTYAKKLGLSHEGLIVRTKAERGMKGSIYKLTEKGMRTFF